ncbi:MAG TPA: hypothetical protein VJK51_00385 [Candidatus Nanoarchaeia archaeon]|nr:hypothetical protein [Candidatus Nanoarchaeia archaeon]
MSTKRGIGVERLFFLFCLTFIGSLFVLTIFSSFSARPSLSPSSTDGGLGAFNSYLLSAPVGLVCCAHFIEKSSIPFVDSDELQVYDWTLPDSCTDSTYFESSIVPSRLCQQDEVFVCALRQDTSSITTRRQCNRQLDSCVVGAEIDCDSGGRDLVRERVERRCSAIYAAYRTYCDYHDRSSGCYSRARNEQLDCLSMYSHLVPE